MKTTKTVTQLALLIALLALVATGVGIFWQGQGEPFSFTTLHGENVTVYGRGLYRYDTVLCASQAIAQDVVTLAIGIPLLVVGIILNRKGSTRGQLLLTGGLGYFLYTYTAMVFMVAYNPLFLVYIALFSLCLFAFILALSGLDTASITRQVSGNLPRCGISIFLALLAAFLGLAWLGRIVPPLLAGTPPYGLEAYTTLPIQVLDLGIIVPVSLITAVLLWRKRPLGYTLASVLLVKALLMGAALVAMIIGEVLAGVNITMVETLMFSGIALAALVFTALMFRGIRSKNLADDIG